MLSGDFAQKIRKLNPRIRFCSTDNSNRPASMYLIKDGEEVTICGVDKNELPEHTMWDKYGHITKSGWRRAVRILIQSKLVDKRQAESVFQTHFDLHEVRRIEPEVPPVKRALDEIEQRKIRGAYRKDDLVDVGRMIRKEQCSPAQ